MANDCDFKTKISGDTKNLKELKSKLDQVLEDNYSLTTDRYQMLFDYAHDVDDWGSKWIVFSKIDIDESGILIDGFSADTPPDGFWKKVSSDYQVTLTTEYTESGIGFGGTTTWVNGEETDRVEMSYYGFLHEYDNETFWTQIGLQSEWDTFDGIKDSLGELYDDLNDVEKEKLLQVFNDNHQEI